VSSRPMPILTLHAAVLNLGRGASVELGAHGCGLNQNVFSLRSIGDGVFGLVTKAA
jgi:hypothetical protein